MIIKTGFFTKVVYKIQDGIIHRSTHPFWGMFHTKSEDQSLNLSEVEYIYNVQLLKSANKSVEFVSKQNSLCISNIKPNIADSLLNTALNMGAKNTEHKYLFVPSSKSMRKITNGYTILCDEFGYIVRKVYNKKFALNDRVEPEQVVYFDNIKEKRINGIAFGKIAGGGSANTIEICGLKDDENKKIYNLILENNTKLHPSSSNIFKSYFPLFSPMRWFKQRETITITDWGLIHKQYGVTINGRKYSSRTSVIEYRSIKSYMHNGLLFKKFDICGETSITTKESYSRDAKNAIWSEFKRHNIVNDIEDIYKASLFHRRGQGKIIVTPDNIMFKKKKEINILKYENIYSCDFRKKHWYSLFGDIYIKGRRIDARAGEGGDVTMTISHMWSGRGKDLIREIEHRKAES